MVRETYDEIGDAPMLLTWMELSTLPVGTKVVYERGDLKLTDATPIPRGTEMLIVLQGLNELSAELWLRPYDETLLAKLRGPGEQECIYFFMPGTAEQWSGKSAFSLPASGRALDLDTLEAWGRAQEPGRSETHHDEPHSQAEEATQDEPAFYTVAIFLVDRAKGGPEEGGWWYDCGQRVDQDLSKQWHELNNSFGHHGIPRVFDNEESACAWCENVNALLDITANEGRREIGSVLSTGRYVAGVYNNYPPHHWPAVRPHYE